MILFTLIHHCFGSFSTNLRIKSSRCPVRLIPFANQSGNGLLSALVQRRNICHIADARTSSFLRPPAQLELTPRKTLSLAVLITPPNVACVRACPRVWIMCACLPACSRRRPYRRRRTNSWYDRLRTCREYMTTDDSSPSFFFEIIQAYIFHFESSMWIHGDRSVLYIEISWKINNDVIAWLWDTRNTMFQMRDIWRLNVNKARKGAFTFSKKYYFCIYIRALSIIIYCSWRTAVHVIFENSYEIRNTKEKIKSIFL